MSKLVRMLRPRVACRGKGKACPALDLVGWVCRFNWAIELDPRPHLYRHHRVWLGPISSTPLLLLRISQDHDT